MQLVRESNQRLRYEACRVFVRDGSGDGAFGRGEGALQGAHGASAARDEIGADSNRASASSNRAGSGAATEVLCAGGSHLRSARAASREITIEHEFASEGGQRRYQLGEGAGDFV